MPHLLLIDATLGAVAIVVAAWIVVRRGLKDRRSDRRREVAGLAGEGAASAEATVVPGFSEGAADPDPAARGPGPGGPEPDSGGPEPDSGGPQPDPDVPAADPGAPQPAGLVPAPSQAGGIADAGSVEDDGDPGPHEPARPEQAPAQLNGVAVAGPDTHTAAAEPAGQPGANGTVTSDGRVSSYYEGADQPMADYLAELGWSEESESGARDWG